MRGSKAGIYFLLQTMGIQIIDTVEFNSSGSYSIPAAATHIRIFAVGGGQGGFAGGRGDWTTTGGNGGAGGSSYDKILQTESLSSLTAVINPGAGGAGGLFYDSSFVLPAPGEDTVITIGSSTLIAFGARPGATPNPLFAGAASGTSGPFDISISGNDSQLAAGGGGAGARNDNSSNSVPSGARGGRGSVLYYPSSLHTPSPGGNFDDFAEGVAAVASSFEFAAGNGGSGGNARTGSSSAGIAGKGGDGIRGGGGGGGGASHGAANYIGGAGGSGGTGYCAIAALKYPGWSSFNTSQKNQIHQILGQLLWT